MHVRYHNFVDVSLDYIFCWVDAPEGKLEYHPEIPTDKEELRQIFGDVL